MITRRRFSTTRLRRDAAFAVNSSVCRPGGGNNRSGFRFGVGALNTALCVTLIGIGIGMDVGVNTARTNGGVW